MIMTNYSRDMSATIRALFEISNAVNNTQNLDDLYASIHQSLGRIMNLENFAIALYHGEKDSMTFPYFVDELDDKLDEIFDISKKQSLSALVINAGKPLLFKSDDIMKLPDKEGRIAFRSKCKVWAGAPLKKKSRAFGALLVQSYKSEDAFNESDLELLNAVADFVAVSIERKMIEEEKAQIEAQLQRAKKMEAIGALAGGVAHDLNNVLTAQVAYPDLLLMDLPDDSPLREMVILMRDAGLKAATIVQDLLTLARRGVVVTDVINLNQIVNTFVVSPECERMAQFHPGVTIRTVLDMGLLDIMGSEVHLFKTVMNLVHNAAEAMPHGGEIVISTENSYIDQPVNGYDEIKEGDYAVLKVSDSGVGIARTDLERIFEPFYTKKKMGRSGTGLGMAVVWGAIKDHQGYIDLKTKKGTGTVFSLYFPATREKRAIKEEDLPFREYAGQGQTILVVDDVEEQRLIATNLLKRMGYEVASVSSGERAVEYMQTHKADLLILDMIMAPGMDGCETYRKISHMHPGQKAIITSGFSETARVKETQQLGAGKYVKKPYTLEKLGMAVKIELKSIQR